MSAEQRTPDTLSTQAENELICEKLLGWTSDSYIEGRKWPWLDRHGNRRVVTPTFTDWASAGLILDVLQGLGTAASYHALKALDAAFYNCRLTPAAIRTVALEYIRSL